jgi:hypothetical protein
VSKAVAVVEATIVVATVVEILGVTLLAQRRSS